MEHTTELIAHSPSDIANTVWVHLKNGDMEGIVSLFHPDCQIFFPPTEPPLIGHDGVRKAFAEMLAMRPTLESTITSEVIIGDTALLHANWVIKTPDGQVAAEGSSTEVARKLENGGWDTI